MENANNSV
jgi:hypothetical protein